MSRAAHHPRERLRWIEPLRRGEGDQGRGAKVIDLASRMRTVRALPSLRAAAGWAGLAQDVEGPELGEARLPVEARESQVAVRATGDSMRGGERPIAEGDWLLLVPRLADEQALRRHLGRAVMVARGDEAEGFSFHVKVPRVVEGRVELHSQNPTVDAISARDTDRVVATVEEVLAPEAWAPAPGSEIPDDDLAGVFGLSAPPEPGLSLIDGHRFLLLEGSKVLAAPDAVGVPEGALASGVPPFGQGETLYVLAREGAGGGPWTYLGVARGGEQGASWQIPEVDRETWRRFGSPRGASGVLDPQWHDAARDIVEQLLAEIGLGGVVGPAPGWRLLGRATRGGLRVERTEKSGAKERTVSLLDIGWVLCARERAEQEGAHLDRAFVDRVRYLRGAPEGSTRYIDTGIALQIVGAVGVPGRED